MRNPRIDGLRKNLRALEIERERLQQRLRAIVYQVNEYRAALHSLADENLEPQNSVRLKSDLHEKKSGSLELKNLSAPVVRVLNPVSRILKRD